jgi:hypothetical protein
MSSMQKLLVDRWGALINQRQLAQILQRQPDGLRVSLARPTSEWARRLNGTKVRIGRRVLFDTVEVAKLIDGCREQPDA